jgi:hypothetical protein
LVGTARDCDGQGGRSVRQSNTMQSLANLVARDLRAVINSPNVRTLFGLCLFEVAYYFAYRYGMSFGKESASPFWFPDSVLLCALLLSAPGRWWIFVLVALPIRLFVVSRLMFRNGSCSLRLRLILRKDCSGRRFCAV